MAVKNYHYNWKVETWDTLTAVTSGNTANIYSLVKLRWTTNIDITMEGTDPQCVSLFGEGKYLMYPEIQPAIDYYLQEPSSTSLGFRFGSGAGTVRYTVNRTCEVLDFVNCHNDSHDFADQLVGNYESLEDIKSRNINLLKDINVSNVLTIRAGASGEISGGTTFSQAIENIPLSSGSCFTTSQAQTNRLNVMTETGTSVTPQDIHLTPWVDYIKNSYYRDMDSDITFTSDVQAYNDWFFNNVAVPDDKKTNPSGSKGDSSSTGDPSNWKDNNSDKLLDNEAKTHPTDTPLNCSGAVNNYVISSSNTQSIFKWFWNNMVDDARTQDMLGYLSGLYGDMGRCITGVRMYPFSAPAGANKQFILGRFNATFSFAQLNTATNMIFNKSIKVERKTGKFLDYAPYTKLYIYLPFIGMRELETNLFMGKTIKVQYFVDFTTGGLDVYVYIGNTVYSQYSGKVGADVPYSVDSGMSLADRTIDSAISGGVTAVSSALGTAVGGPVGGAIAGELSGQFAGNTQTTGSNPLYNNLPSNANIMNSPTQVQLFYIYPAMPTKKELDDYGRTNGYVCMRTKKLSDIKGFTVCQNPKLHFGKTKIDNKVIMPTREEYDEIMRLLESGVYL